MDKLVKQITFEHQAGDAQNHGAAAVRFDIRRCFAEPVDGQIVGVIRVMHEINRYFDLPRVVNVHYHSVDNRRGQHNLAKNRQIGAIPMPFGTQVAAPVKALECDKQAIYGLFA